MTLAPRRSKTGSTFAQDTDGAWPSFPLPLGNTLGDNKGDFVTVELLNEADTEAFETACREAGARLSGGVMACAALAENRSRATRRTTVSPRPTHVRPASDALSLGWFASLFPVTVPIGDGAFPEVARAAQESFNASKYLANVPFERVAELASLDDLGIKLPTQPAMMVSFLDFRKIPVAELWEQTKFGIYGDNLSHGSNQHVDQPARRPNHRHGLLPGQCGRE